MNLSVITINYNNKAGLKKTFESLFNQTFTGFEYIVIDGGSGDGSAELIEQHAERMNYWISEADNGIYDAINKGILKAKGAYLMFLNSGDYLCDDGVLELCNNAVIVNPSTDVFYGDTWFIFDNPAKPYLNRHPEKLNLSFFTRHNINHQSVIIRASLFNEFGLYPPEYKLAADHWLFLKCEIANKHFQHIGSPVAVYDFSGISFTSRAKYDHEMQTMWNDIVPVYARKVVEELNTLKHDNEYKLIKAAQMLNKKIQKLKGKRSG